MRPSMPKNPQPRNLRVFLSGRIDGVELDRAAGWRGRASAHLRSAGFDVYDPTRLMRAVDSYVPRPNEVFHNDRWNLHRSDIVLVNLDLPERIESRNAPFFTIGEMFLAHAAGMPIVAIGQTFAGRPGYEAIVTRTWDDLESALEYIVSAYRVDT